MGNTLRWTNFRIIVSWGTPLPKAPLELHPLNWYWNVQMPTELTLSALAEHAERVESWLRSLPTIVSVEHIEEGKRIRTTRQVA